MSEHNKQIRNLTETANNLNEVLGAGGGFSQQQPSTFSTAPRTPFDFPSRPTPSIANTTQGLYRSGSGSWMFYDGLPVTEEWQNQWDKWVNSGADSGVEMPWPPQFQGMFENNNVFDFDPDNPNSGWFYWNSVFGWLFGNQSPAGWGSGVLGQLNDAGIIDLPDIGGGGSIWWSGFYFYLNSNPSYQRMYIQMLFGDPSSPEYEQVSAEWSQTLQSNPYMYALPRIWQWLYEAQKATNGVIYFVNPPIWW